MTAIKALISANVTGDHFMEEFGNFSKYLAAYKFVIVTKVVSNVSVKKGRNNQ